MRTTDKVPVIILLDILAGHNVREIVCSPGSRNIPLLTGIASDNRFNSTSVTDERAAAFLALGKALSSERPVALCCTSGSALLNYAPAIAEAYYQGIPLIVISADRPLEWIDQDDSQTIRQYQALNNIVKNSYDLSDHTTTHDDGEWYVNRILNDAMLTALSGKPGPVHINIRLSVPLNGINYKEHSNERIIRKINPFINIDRGMIRKMAEFASKRKILIVCGFMQPDNKMNRAIARLSKLPNVTIMAETISNLHLDAECYAIDTLMCRMQIESPDLIISVGGALVSRMLKEQLRKFSRYENGNHCGPEHWCVGEYRTTVDSFKSLTTIIDGNGSAFLNLLGSEMLWLRKKYPEDYISLPADTYASDMKGMKRESIIRMDLQASTSPWSELSALHIFFNNIPDKINLCISNGTCIRYAQILSRSIPHAEFCNRGVSGIDGCTSTAVGVASINKSETWLLTGDTSFGYDIAGLQMASYLSIPIKIFVVSNQGGGIFRFIKSSCSLEIREDMLCCNTFTDIKGLAATYGFRYMETDSTESLMNVLDEIKNIRESVIVNITVNGEESAKILKKALCVE